MGNPVHASRPDRTARAGFRPSTTSIGRGRMNALTQSGHKRAQCFP